MTVEQREEVILEYLKKFPTLKFTDLARLLLKDNKQIKVDEQVIRKQIAKIANASKSTIEQSDETLKDEDKVTIIFQDETKWSVKENRYQWDTTRGSIDLTVEFVDELFYEYSEYGLNLTQTEVINKHNLKVWQWHSIKRVLELFKKSNIFSPYTVESTPKEELASMIKQKMEALMGNIGYQVVKQYDNSLRKEYKKVIKEYTDKDLQQQSLLLELQDLIPEAFKNYKPVIRIAAPVEPTDQKKIITVFIFDVHFGAETRKGSFYKKDELPEYSPEKTEEMFAEIADEINALQPTEVHLMFGGDNIETFTGLNHTDSWKGIAKGQYGSQLVIRAYKAFTSFISAISNVAGIYAVPGNHDRATEKAQVDGQGYVAEILFELIRLAFDNKIPVKYDEKVVSECIDGIHYIMSHGHMKFTNMNAAELILEYGDATKYNLLVSGHLHSRKLAKDHARFRQITCPSLFPGNDYSVNNGWFSCPGVVVTMNSGNGKPRVIDYPL